MLAFMDQLQQKHASVLANVFSYLLMLSQLFIKTPLKSSPPESCFNVFTGWFLCGNAILFCLSLSSYL